MKHTIKIFLTGLAVLLIGSIGCKTATKAAQDAAKNAPSTELQGTYSTGCYSGPEHDMKKTITYEGLAFDKEIVYYESTSKSCKTEAFVIKQGGVFTKGGDSRAVPGTTLIDYTVSTFTGEIKSAKGETISSKIVAEKIESGKPVSLFNKELKVGFRETIMYTQNVKNLGLYRVEETKLQIENHDNCGLICNPERAKTLSATAFNKQ